MCPANRFKTGLTTAKAPAGALCGWLRLCTRSTTTRYGERAHTAGVQPAGDPVRTVVEPGVGLSNAATM